MIPASRDLTLMGLQGASLYFLLTDNVLVGGDPSFLGLTSFPNIERLKLYERSPSGARLLGQKLVSIMDVLTSFPAGYMENYLNSNKLIVQVARMYNPVCGSTVSLSTGSSSGSSSGVPVVEIPQRLVWKRARADNFVPAQPSTDQNDQEGAWFEPLPHISAGDKYVVIQPKLNPYPNYSTTSIKLGVLEPEALLKGLDTGGLTFEDKEYTTYDSRDELSVVYGALMSFWQYTDAGPAYPVLGDFCAPVAYHNSALVFSRCEDIQYNDDLRKKVIPYYPKKCGISVIPQLVLDYGGFSVGLMSTRPLVAVSKGDGSLEVRQFSTPQIFGGLYALPLLTFKRKPVQFVISDNSQPSICYETGCASLPRMFSFTDACKSTSLPITFSYQATALGRIVVPREDTAVYEVYQISYFYGAGTPIAQETVPKVFRESSFTERYSVRRILVVCKTDGRCVQAEGDLAFPGDVIYNDEIVVFSGGAVALDDLTRYSVPELAQMLGADCRDCDTVLNLGTSLLFTKSDIADQLVRLALGKEASITAVAVPASKIISWSKPEKPPVNVSEELDTSSLVLLLTSRGLAVPVAELPEASGQVSTSATLYSRVKELFPVRYVFRK